MSSATESLAEKQRRLAADIARQRTALAGAYRDIAKPILYTEYGLRGFGFLRQNPWLLTIIPATFSTTTSVITLVRTLTAKPAPRKPKLFGRKAEREARRAKATITDHAMKWGGRGWRLFKIYRRVRKYFP